MLTGQQNTIVESDQGVLRTGDELFIGIVTFYWQQMQDDYEHSKKVAGY
jgi:hypothetical protein